MNRKVRVLAAFTLLAVLVGGFEVDARRKKRRLPTKLLTCDTVWGDDPGEGSFRLGNNLVCSGFGLQIARDGITVDLGGHRLRSTNGFESGLRIFGRNDVTVRNGAITGFFDNFIVGSSNRIRLENLVLKDANNQDEIQDGTGHSVVGNTFINEGVFGLEDQGGPGVPQGVISGNTFVNTSINLQAADDSTVIGNRIFGGDGPGIHLTDGSERNVITRNSIVGVEGAADNGTGILIEGGDADDNVISRNVIRGQATAGGRGIDILDADRTVIAKNNVTANRTGVILRGAAQETTITANNLSANWFAGLIMSSASGGRITENVVNENGRFGIEVGLGSAPLIQDNSASFNGFLNAADDNDGWGIVAQNATGSDNAVQGNDAPPGFQCSTLDADLCDVGSVAPPPVHPCDTPVTAAFTLRHPLVCDGSLSGLRIRGTGFTVNLGRHVLVGGDLGSQEAALQVEAPSADVTVLGGVMANSKNGINLLSPAAEGPHGVRIKGALVVGNDIGVVIQGQDLAPDSPTVTAGRNTVERSTIVTPSGLNVLITEAPRNSITRNLLIDGTGVIVDRSVRNSIRRNVIVGTGNGVGLANSASTSIATGNVVASNRIVGQDGRGVDLQDGVANTITGNSIVGASNGIRLVSGGVIGGSQENTISRNAITASDLDGIALVSDSSRNRLISNVVNASNDDGIDLSVEADGNVLSRNRTDENGTNGIFVFNPLPPSTPDTLTRNSANRNGFLNVAVGDGIGFGINAASDSIASRNTASGNDDTDQCDPDPIC